MMSDNIARNM